MGRDVCSWQILLQKDFAHLGEQYWFNVRRVYATPIQKSPRPADNIRAGNYTSGSRS
jgi:hypothetical protein